jgi:hypothetical protein
MNELTFSPTVARVDEVDRLADLVFSRTPQTGEALCGPAGGTMV